VKYPPKSRGLHCSHFYGRRSWATRIEPGNAMALCHGCHQHISSYPFDHVDLWEERFSKEETEYIHWLHRNFNIKKRDVATEETYQKLRRMLDEERSSY